MSSPVTDGSKTATITPLTRKRCCRCHIMPGPFTTLLPASLKMSGSTASSRRLGIYHTRYVSPERFSDSSRIREELNETPVIARTVLTIFFVGLLATPAIIRRVSAGQNDASR